MLKVLLVDNTPDRASELKRALSEMEGVAVACTVESAVELFDRVAEHKPDIVLIETDSPSRDVLEQLAAMSSSAPRPVVMFTGAPGRLDPIMRVAIERFEADQQLRAELVETRERLEDRKLVERAKGILMKQRGMSEEEAFAALRSHAMDRGMRLGEAARQLIDIAALLG